MDIEEPQIKIAIPAKSSLFRNTWIFLFKGENRWKTELAVKQNTTVAMYTKNDHVWSIGLAFDR